MAEYEDKHKIDYRQGGDTIDDFAQKYMANMVAIYRYLNEIRTLTPNKYDYTDPEPNQLRIKDGKLYVRNEDNTAWILLGELKVNFGFKASSEVKFIDNSIFKFEAGKIYARENPSDSWVLLGDMKENFGFRETGAGFLTTDDISIEKIADINNVNIANAVTTDMLSKAKLDNINSLDFSEVLTTADVSSVSKEPNKLVRTNASGMIDGDITGNAAKIAGIMAAVNNVQDGEVLTYRAATNTWHNEPKGTIGAGKALNIYDNGKLVCTYSGDTSYDLDIRRDAGVGGIVKDDKGDLVLKDVVYPNDNVRMYQYPDGSIELAPRVFFTHDIVYDKDGNIVLREDG